MKKKVMKNMITLLLVFVLISGGVCAEGNWGEINDGKDLESNEVSDNENISGNISVGESDVGEQDYEVEELQPSGDGEEYTINFYVALGLGMLGILIIVLFIYLFMREPKNKWKH